MNNKFIAHYGTPRHSGRYPWGSGDDPQQRNKNFLGYVNMLKEKGLSEVEIAKSVGMTTSQLRNKKSIIKSEQRKSEYTQAVTWKDKGISNVEIGKRLGMNESSVRALLNPAIQKKSELAKATANVIKDNIKEKKYVDVGIGVERHLGVTRTKLKTAISELQNEGYLLSYIKVEQLGTGKQTSMMVISKPSNKNASEVLSLRNKGLSDSEISKKMGIDESEITTLVKKEYANVYANKDKIKSIPNYSDDGGETYRGLEPVKSVSSKRIKIVYDEEGGSNKDGLIELRKGIPDISLGNAKYAQVRIGVDDTHYMKGMAVYSDKLPKGIDILYNSNKKIGTPESKVFKPMKNKLDGTIDSDNPFGASVRQRHYKDSSGKEHLSSINIVNEEGEWSSKWSKSLSSQMLSKQSSALAKKQLDLTYKIKKEEFDDIMSLTNPAVKKRLLDSFAGDCDSAAVHLKAAALPREGWHALIPFPNMKETEVYAPNYRDGEKVVLIRYPHGGIFEIPELTVNNKYKPAKEVLGTHPKDAIGIHPKVAEKISGADFDGDAVLVIPNNNRAIQHKDSLEKLKGFDPKELYKLPDDAPEMDTRTRGIKMGDISNLITDMTIRKANTEEISRAVRHSMVVIDAQKHHLDYKQSYIDHGIAALKKKYQGSASAGASTLISRASSEKRVGVRKEKTNIKKMTDDERERFLSGKKVYDYSGETYNKITKRKDGTIKVTPTLRTIKSTKMAEVEDAFNLSSGTVMEHVYATHANKLKALGNTSRKESYNIIPMQTNSEAKIKYANEVKSLNAKLHIALQNAPLERQALVIANAKLAAIKESNPDMDKDQLKKANGMALMAARLQTGAKKQRIDITDDEWAAIQSGAISNNKLSQILNNTDLDKIKQLATPRTALTITPAKRAKAERLLASGHTQSEVADAIGVSLSTLSKMLD